LRMSQEPSSVLGETDVSKPALFQTPRGDMSSFVLVDKDALMRALQKAERLQTLVDDYEGKERSRQVDIVNESVTLANTAQNAQSSVLPAPLQPAISATKGMGIWSILRSTLLTLGFLFLLTYTFEYGRVQAAARTHLKPSPPLLASLTSMYDSTQVQRTIRYMSLRRPEIGYYPVEWVTWGVEALDYFLNGPYY